MRHDRFARRVTTNDTPQRERAEIAPTLGVRGERK